MIEEALEVIASTRFAAIATLTSDGDPYATPITYQFDSGRFTWNSSPDSIHSQNIVHDGRVSLSIVEDAANDIRAVYINGVAQATKETSFDKKWSQNLQVFEMHLGELDIDKSTPGRFYFRGVDS